MKKYGVQILLIAILCLLAYSNTFNVPFLFDDKKNIINNPAIKDLSTALEPLKEGAIIKSGTRYVGFLTFALNYALHGLNVTGYHIVNIAIHFINALLVYLLVHLTFKTPQMRGIDPESRFSDGIAVFSALLFVCHPVQTQAVTYIVQRFASLATLFYLFSLTMYVMARLPQMPVQTIPADAQYKPEAGKGKDKANFTKGKAKVKARDKAKAKAKAKVKVKDDALVKTQGEVQTKKLSKRFPTSKVVFYALSVISAVMAMKTKEVAFTLPVVITIYEFFFFGGSWKKRILYLAPLLLTMFIIPLSLINIDKPLSEVMDDVGEATRVRSSLSRWEYLITQFRVIVTYLRLLVLPINQNLDYAYSTYHSFLNPEVFFSFLVLLLIFCLGVYIFNRSRAGGTSIRLVSFGIFWFFITLSVESSIIPIRDVIFEHRVYLPSVGAFIGITTFAFSLVGRLKRRWPPVEKALILALTLIVVVLTGITYARNRVWRDPITLWEDVLRKSPKNDRPHYNLGFYYQEKGLIDKAIEQYQTAIKLNPDNERAYNNLGLAYQSKGLIDKAIEQYQTAIKLNPDNEKAYNNLGLAYQSKGLIDKAIEQYKTIIKLNPDIPEVYFNLGLAYQSKGLIDKAIEQYKTIIKLNPDYLDAYNNLGLVYQSKGLIDKAIEQYQTAIKLNPDIPEVYFNLGLAYQSRGLTDKAIESYRACLRIKPKWEKPHYNLGYLYYKKGDMEKARREFGRVLEINPEDHKARRFLGSMIKGENHQL
jgi:tetratricopeptide (TPR) repeat protein